MKYFEMAFLYFLFIFVALFAHPYLTYEFSTPKYFFLTIFITISIILFLFRKWREKNFHFYISCAQIGWLWFGIAAVVSTFTVLRQNPAYFSFSFENGLYAVLTVFIVFYFSNFFDTKRDVTLFLFVVVVTGFLVSIEALNNYYTGNSYFLGYYGSGKMGMKATIGNVNFVSDFVGSLLPIAVYFTISNGFGWQLPKTYRGLWLAVVFSMKGFALVNVFLFYFIVLLSGTRAVILSLMIGVVVSIFSLLFYYLYHKKEKAITRLEQFSKVFPNATKILRVLNGVLVGVLLLIVLGLPQVLSTPNNFLKTTVDVGERTASIFDPRGFQTTGGKARVLAWLAAIYQWKDNPLFGAGIGTYMVESIGYMGDVVQDHPEYVDAWSNFNRTHNDYFQVLGEMGLFGILSVAFTLLVMVWMFFRLLIKLKDRDDALLLIVLAAAFLEILGHTFTEFPLQMLPNQLWALAIGGIGFGSYFNRTNILAWRKTLSFRWILVGMVVVAVVGILSGTLKYKGMMSEVMFKEGNAYYGGLPQIDEYRGQIPAEEQKVRDAQKALQERSGDYQKLQPDIYLAQKLPLLRTNNPLRIPEEQLRVRALDDLSQEIKKEQTRLDTLLGQVEQNRIRLEERGIDIYETSRDGFLRSLDYAPYYGKSQFYLAMLMVRQERRSLLQTDQTLNADALKRFFTENIADRRHIAPTYRVYPLAEDVAWLEKKVSEGIPFSTMQGLVGLSNWIDLQTFQDALSYFDSSFIGFDERNSYRIMGKYSFNLLGMTNQLTQTYQQLVQQNPEWSAELQPLIARHQAQANTAFEKFQKSYDHAIYILPGNWQMLPDWEQIYVEYINLLLKTKAVQSIYPKVKEVALLRVRASEWMHEVQRLGIPDDIAVLYAQLTQAFLDQGQYQETLYVLDDGMNMMRKAYDWNKIDLETNPYLTDAEKERIRNFLTAYQTLLQKRAEFLDQVSNVYEYAQNTGSFESQWLEDWKFQQFTQETWPQANYAAIMELLKQAKAEMPML